MQIKRINIRGTVVCNRFADRIVDNHRCFRQTTVFRGDVRTTEHVPVVLRHAAALLGPVAGRTPAPGSGATRAGNQPVLETLQRSVCPEIDWQWNGTIRVERCY